MTLISPPNKALSLCVGHAETAASRLSPPPDTTRKRCKRPAKYVSSFRAGRLALSG